MPLTVSINGADNSGKSAQIALLPPHWSIVLVKSLHQYDEEMFRITQEKRLADWWWTSSDREFVVGIHNAIAARHAQVESETEADLAVFDRGALMFEAVCTAVIATKNEGMSLKDASARYADLLTDQSIPRRHETINILLKQHADTAEAVNISLAREPGPHGARYIRYNQLLHELLAQQEQQGLYIHVIVEKGGDSHREVQDELRRCLTLHGLPKTFPSMLKNVRDIYVFCGLPASGKSTAAAKANAWLRQSSGRLSIKYLVDLASSRVQHDMRMSKTEKGQAFAIAGELDAYCAAHNWLLSLTIDDGACYQQIRWLKILFGNTLHIVYVDTERRLREERSDAPIEPEAPPAPEGFVTQEGALRRIAGLVLDNNGTKGKAQAALERYLRSHKPKPDPATVAARPTKKRKRA